MVELAARIAEARRDAGMRREDVAYHLNVGLRTVQRWETGETTPSIRRLDQLARLTRRPLTFFLQTNGAAKS